MEESNKKPIKTFDKGDHSHMRLQCKQSDLK